MKKFFLLRRNVAVVGSVLLLLTFITACNKSLNNDDDDRGVSGLMAFNVAPDVAANITLSGYSLTPSPLIFSNYTGGYSPVYAGGQSISTYNASSGISIASSVHTFEPDKYYSLFVAGANNNYRNIVVQDNFDSLTSVSGKAYVRYINAVPDSSGAQVNITSGGSTVVNDNARFAEVSDFTAVNAGNITVNLNSGAVNKSRTFAVEDRKVYTVLLIGLPAATSGDDSLQIRYVLNGTLDTDAERSAARSMNIK
jgi:hypothetical protein